MLDRPRGDGNRAKPPGFGEVGCRIAGHRGRRLTVVHDQPVDARPPIHRIDAVADGDEIVTRIADDAVAVWRVENGERCHAAGGEGRDAGAQLQHDAGGAGEPRHGHPVMGDGRALLAIAALDLHDIAGVGGQHGGSNVWEGRCWAHSADGHRKFLSGRPGWRAAHHDRRVKGRHAAGYRSTERSEEGNIFARSSQRALQRPTTRLAWTEDDRRTAPVFISYKRK